MGVPMLISKHALNCCKGSANERNIKNKSHLFFISEVQPTLLKGSALPQKHMIKCPKNYK